VVYKTHILPLAIREHSFDLECLENLDASVDEMFAELERRKSQEMIEELCPYFGVVWPAAQALSEWMSENLSTQLAGKTFLELGCGLALPSLLAARLGAAVTATDLHPDVPIFFERNIRRNLAGGNATPVFVHLDWRQLPEQAAPWDWIVASDVLYERSYAGTLLSFLERHLSRGGQALVADPQRPFCEQFEKQIQESSLRFEKHTWPVKTPGQPCVIYHLDRKDPS
jgi:predicted nicotinamide N-methyase